MTLSYFKQHFRYGRGAYNFHKLRAARIRDFRHLLPTGFYTGLMLYPFRARRFDKAVLIAPLFTLAQLANGFGYLSAVFEARSGRGEARDCERA